ncbi:hypothetical protein [Salimicrobium halophilum]|uniref:Uncharacterized protein n=1 Tax=Salimicrobium halophilum TaxID=86666 RepID=A0A1G8WEI5_9BACI|nr:hypothetical protein [Salimicrobium halophilum]SDJ76613.1 hypothetical protein SAMN04490247_3152 [Salimicrobium halophilum]
MTIYVEIAFERMMDMIQNDETKYLFYKHENGALTPADHLDLDFSKLRRDQWFASMTVDNLMYDEIKGELS